MKESNIVISSGGEGTWMKWEITITLTELKNHFLVTAKMNAKKSSAIAGRGQRMRIGKNFVT